MRKAIIKLISILTIILLILFVRGTKVKSDEVNKNLLSELYYENENVAFFHSSNVYEVLTNDINLYAINWLSKMNEVISVSFSEEFMEYIEKSYISNDLNFSIKSKNDLLNFHNMLSVEKFFFGDIENKSYYYDILSDACTEEQWFYEQSDNYEDRVIKTQILYLVLQNFNELNNIPENIKSNMVVTLKSFLNNTNYFNINNIELKRNLIDFEIVILQSLILLDSYTDENLLDLIKTKEDWLNQNIGILNNELETTNGTTDIIFLNDCILNLNQVLVYTGIYEPFNKSYADKFDFKLINEVYLMDTQMTYKILKVCNILDKTIETNINNFINENINYWTFKVLPNTNLKELYYSIKLAKIYNINYNTNKIINFINKYENSTSLQDIYYIYLLKKELSTSFLANENTLRVIAENIKNFDSQSVEQKFHLIYLSKSLGLNSEYINDITEKISKQNIESKILETNVEGEFYYLNKIAKALNIELDSHFINNEVEKYKFVDGGYCMEQSGDIPNTISTYRMSELQMDYGIQFDAEELSRISTFINKVAGTKGGYYYNQSSNPSDIYNYSNNFSFFSFYYGETLNAMIE